jgi:hypothetical protein
MTLHYFHFYIIFLTDAIDSDKPSEKHHSFSEEEAGGWTAAGGRSRVHPHSERSFCTIKVQDS